MIHPEHEQQEPVEEPDNCMGPPLAECLVCGAVGLPERIADHDCRAFKRRDR